MTIQIWEICDNRKILPDVQLQHNTLMWMTLNVHKTEFLYGIHLKSDNWCSAGNEKNPTHSIDCCFNTMFMVNVLP